MHKNSLRQRALALVVGITVLAFSGWASADPPSRVARLGYMSGAVSFSPAGEDDWVQATINRPLTTGDRLWADAGARAEIQVGGAMMRMNAGTSVSVLNLDDQIAQLQLTQGALNVRVRRLEPDQVFEVDTPNLAFTLRQPGEYRIEVDPDGNATTIVVRKGQGEVYGEDAAYVIDSRQPYRFIGTGLREYQYVDAPQLDEFDRWSSERDRALRQRRSPPAMYRRTWSAIRTSMRTAPGASTRPTATSGSRTAWPPAGRPTATAIGHGSTRGAGRGSMTPLGLRRVPLRPLGEFSGTWGWVPGPVRTRAYYAPALVVFVGGDNFQLSDQHAATSVASRGSRSGRARSIGRPIR